jgi:class 3 adenylate cyclase
VAKTNGCFSNEQELKKRLDLLIPAIETASLVYLGRAKGKPAARVIWRKERRLRKMADRLKEKEAELDTQKKYLRAAGGVTAEQLNMNPISVPDGVYAFMDMVGSASIRNCLKPRDYFLVLNLCHEIAADNAARFACRVDNIIGDSVFFQNVSVFDDPEQGCLTGLGERVMLMTSMLSSVFNDIHRLKLGQHPMDRDKRVITLMKNHGVDLHFRAGLECGTALIGPLGSQKRKIVTALGRAVNTASRLESCGDRDGIHTTDTIVKILENALISRDTCMIQEIAKEKINKDWVLSRQYIPFFDFYKKHFNLSHDVVQTRNNVSYKEFSRDITYFIKCIPTLDDPKTCPGI